MNDHFPTTMIGQVRGFLEELAHDLAQPHYKNANLWAKWVVFTVSPNNYALLESQYEVVTRAVRPDGGKDILLPGFSASVREDPDLLDLQLRIEIEYLKLKYPAGAPITEYFSIKPGDRSVEAEGPTATQQPPSTPSEPNECFTFNTITKEDLDKVWNLAQKESTNDTGE